ncbi:amino acid/polyamine transporter I [Bisporella sp. PMI_857]|nr:amino acid/polyamine transporter I [Bisporella sp. PMI_857]
MTQDDYNVNVQQQDDDSVIGLDEDDLAIIQDAENDSTKVVTKLPARPYQLGYISVFCIIINKMIGTGIFDTPSSIMYDTHSVGFTLIFWLLGSIATLAGTFVFIEYGLTIPRWQLSSSDTKIFTPRSGGEFNYLNYLLKTPKFFASCVYGVTFVLIGNAAANALSFAAHVVTASGDDVYHGASSEKVSNTVRGIAVATMTAVCLLHGIWRRAGIWVNNMFAIFKLLMLLIIIILGFMSIGGKVFDTPPPVSDNLSPSNSFKNAQTDAYGYAEAYLSIVFTFGGFNQANYILGEVKNPKKIFRSATLLAVSTVCVSYMLVNIAYMIVVPASSQMNGNVAEQFILLTLGRVSPYGKAHSAQILNAFMAFSSLGNVIVSTYTAARVKQEIAKEGILPFVLGDSARRGWHEKTPLGALILHWFFALLIIFCTWGVSSPVTAYTIVFGIYSYTIDAFMSVIIGIGLLALRFWSSKTHWHLKSPANGIISIVSAFIFVIANLFPIIALWIPPSGEFKGLQRYPWYLVPTIGLLLMLSAVFYWVGFVAVELRVERSPFFHTEHGEPVQVAEVVAFDWVIKEPAYRDD